MSSAGATVRDLREMDDLARLDSPIHRLHPVGRTAVTVAFVVAVVSMPRSAVSGLVPFLVFPVAVAAQAGLPAGPIIRRVLLAGPFALMLALPSLWLDRSPAGALGPLVLTSGALTFASVVLRVCLTVAAAVVLVATTGMDGVGFALRRLGLPRQFCVQLLLLHRYVLVLAEEAERLLRARDLRSFGGGRDLRTWGALVGQILLRALARAGRVHGAMLARGFDGDVHLLRTWRFGGADLAFLLAWLPLLAAFRLLPVSDLLGRALLGGLA